MLAHKQSHVPVTQPQEPLRLRPATDKLTDVQVFLHTLAWHVVGASLCGPCFACTVIYSAAYAGSAH